MPARRSSSDLLELVPHGLLGTRSWLLKQGVARHALDNWVKSGKLVSLCPGVYKCAGSRIAWQGVVCSLQRMDAPLHVGGITALEVHGRAHYLPLAERRVLHLYGQSPLPSWANKLGLAESFRRRGVTGLAGVDPQGRHRLAKAPATLEMPWGDGFWTLRVSTLEQACLEVLKDVPGEVSFEHAALLMEGLAGLSPRRLAALLRRTASVKVKRLFFWLAERQGHAWLERLDPEDYDLGRGKRALAKHGCLVREYGITVPRGMHG